MVLLSPGPGLSWWPGNIMGRRGPGNLTFHGHFLGSSAQLRGVSETFRVGLGKDPRHLFSCGNSSVGRAPPCQGGGRRFESGFPLCKRGGPSLRTSSPSFLWRRSQAVRQRPAKPLFPGSNPGGASRVSGVTHITAGHILAIERASATR